MNVDPAWEPVKAFIVKELGVDEKKEQFCFDSYVPGELSDLIETQKRIVAAQKARGDKKLFRSSPS